MSHFVIMFGLLFGVVGVSYGKTITDGPQERIFTKILGGYPVYFSDFNYKVSIRAVLNSQHACSGVILKPEWILTSGASISTASPSDVLVTTGAHNVSEWQTEHSVSSIILRTTTEQLRRHDLALIKLVEPIELGEHAATINLPSRNTVPGDIGVVSSWGPTEIESTNSHLKHLQQLVRANWVCSIMVGETVNDDEICASNTEHLGLCTLDDGAPLVQDEAVIGISSWFRSCGDGRTDVYTRIWSHIDWIKEQISEEQTSEEQISEEYISEE